MEHILYLMTVEYKHGFLMTLLGPMSRSSPDLNKQYIVKIECKIYCFNSLIMIIALDLSHFHFQYFHFDGLLWQKVAHFLPKDLECTLLW